MPGIKQTSWLDQDVKQVTGSLNGYAASPGSLGDLTKKCRHCGHYAHQGGYPKCGLMREHWTRGKGTDIKASAPACRLFSEKELKHD